jgi:hypothetical protein
MENKKHIKSFNEATENLNISVVIESKIKDFDPDDNNDIKWTEIYTKYLRESDKELTVGNFIHWLRTFYISPDLK